MSSRSSYKKEKVKKDPKTSNKTLQIPKAKETLKVENSIYDPSTSLDVSVRWDTTSSGSSHPQLVLDGALVVSPLPLKTPSSGDEPKDLHEWALKRVSEFQKNVLDKKDSESISFDFKLSSATDESTQETDNIIGIIDLTSEYEFSPSVTREEIDSKDDQHLFVILRQSELVWLLDMPSQYLTDPEDQELKRKREERTEKPEVREVGVQLYRVFMNGLDQDEEFKVQYRGVQVSRPATERKASQCSRWDIYDSMLDNSSKDTRENETISSLTRIERAVSWNSYGAGILRVTGRSENADLKDESPLSLPIPFKGQRAVVTSVVWHPSIPDLLAIGYSMDGQAVGAVDCWTLKNCSRPERRYHLNRPVVNLDFSRPSPSILVAETTSGVYLADIRTSSGSWLRFLANYSGFGVIKGSVLPSPAKYIIGANGNPVKIDLNPSQSTDLKLVYEPNGNYCVGTCTPSGGDIALYSSLCPNRKKLAQLTYHSAPIVALKWASKSIEVGNHGSVFVSASMDSTVALWSVHVPEKPLRVLQTLPPSIIIDADCLLIQNSLPTFVVVAITPDHLHVWKLQGLIINENMTSRNGPKNPSISWSMGDIDQKHSEKSSNVYFSRVSLLEKGSTIAVGLSDGRLVLFPLI